MRGSEGGSSSACWQGAPTSDRLHPSAITSPSAAPSLSRLCIRMCSCQRTRAPKVPTSSVAVGAAMAFEDTTQPPPLDDARETGALFGVEHRVHVEESIEHRIGDLGV